MEKAVRNTSTKYAQMVRSLKLRRCFLTLRSRCVMNRKRPGSKSISSAKDFDLTFAPCILMLVISWRPSSLLVRNLFRPCFGRMSAYSLGRTDGFFGVLYTSRKCPSSLGRKQAVTFNASCTLELLATFRTNSASLSSQCMQASSFSVFTVVLSATRYVRCCFCSEYGITYVTRMVSLKVLSRTSSCSDLIIIKSRTPCVTNPCWSLFSRPKTCVICSSRTCSIDRRICAVRCSRASAA
mmetsp:Transcript_13495/g.29731  ORF Transcript_13495/g.29731 Transcript_13495/m.29731 type:complete len:239 (+) Transcript_13495:1610-2326(+)